MSKNSYSKISGYVQTVAYPGEEAIVLSPPLAHHFTQNRGKMQNKTLLCIFKLWVGGYSFFIQQFVFDFYKIQILPLQDFPQFQIYF